VKTLLESTTHPLAIDPDAKFPMGDPTSLDPGDTVVLLTDGFFEARPPGGEFFGREGVLEVVRANCSKPAREIIESLYDAVQHHTGQEACGDDLTAVVIKLDA
jgi:phosphoserine phosphatase